MFNNTKKLWDILRFLTIAIADKLYLIPLSYVQ